MNKKTKFIIIGIVALLVVGLIIFFATRTNKEKKIVEDENNYSLNFEYLSEDKKTQQKISFIYRNKKLKDITLTLYFETRDVARGVYNEYKSLKEFKDYKQEKNRVILYYKEKDIKEYRSYSKDDVINEFTAMGYIYKK